MTTATWLALSDERDRWLRRVLDAWQEGYQAALNDAVVESLLYIWPEPGRVTEIEKLRYPVTEIEKRRYPPDGREHFSRPRPGDYTGVGLAEFNRRRRQHG